MTLLVLRLAAPLQSWSGYREQVNIGTAVPTAALPRKSGVNGLIGAALGPRDRGYGSARDLDGIGRRYELAVRVETRNATTEDFQVVGPLPPEATARAAFVGKLGTASTKAFPTKRGGGNFATTVSRRDFLSHSEFIVALQTEAEVASSWLAALRTPTFMPYLGRRSCAPTFPFLLGLYPGDVESLFSQLPHVDRHGKSTPTETALKAYWVTGDYNRHHADEPTTNVYSPPVSDRRGQLAWAKEHLSR